MIKNNDIEIKGARVHNLKNISVKIPKNKFIVISGVSGSGKSSLAFNTLFAEGQRRYIESLSSYARQFLGKLQKPDVDQITGISPAIAIEQRTITKNPRSTVATTTEIYEYFKLLFSRIGKTISPISGEQVKKHSVKNVINFILKQKNNEHILILAKYKKKNLELSNLIQQGFSKLFYNDQTYKIKELIKKQKVNLNPIETFIVIDRITSDDKDKKRISDSIETAFFEGGGSCFIKTNNSTKKFSNKFELDGIQFKESSIHLFSFNNPYGACKNCQGFGSVLDIDPKKVIPNENISLFEGAVICWSGNKLIKWKERFITRSSKFNFPIHRPYKKLSEEEKDILWNGRDKCKGISQFFDQLEKKKYKIQNRVLIARYRGKTECKICNGSRLTQDALYVKIINKNIHEITSMSILEALNFFQTIKLSVNEQKIADRLIKEIISRLYYLNEIGLGYLNLNRRSNTLSGGESQRINLATSIGSSLVGAMYILDEPSIGLHPKDTKRLITIIKKLRDIGNTVIVIEHDEDIIKQADQIIDVGPNAGIDGGKIIFQGKIKDITKKQKSLTTQYLTGKLTIPIKFKKRQLKENILLTGINKHNIKNMTVKFPLNCLTVISGVSGSGKSTLVKDVLKPAFNNMLQKSSEPEISYKTIHCSITELSTLELIDQKPIGKSSRSNPATYLKFYDDIRKLYASQELSKIRNYKSGFFSFNIDGGRCEHCKGEGERKIEMQFMADVHLECEHCKGKRFKKEILEVTFKNKNISEILNLSVKEAMDFFTENKLLNLAKKIKPLNDVGLSYIKLGQSSNTLSGGEAQRIKLASFLSKGDTNHKTLFIFDEPTTGLHFHDISKLLNSFYALIKQGHSIICIEHNLDIIKCAEWIIELGPEGGDKGGELIFEGTPKEMIKSNSITGKYLKNKF